MQFQPDRDAGPLTDAPMASELRAARILALRPAVYADELVSRALRSAELRRGSLRSHQWRIGEPVLQLSVESIFHDATKAIPLTIVSAARSLRLNGMRSETDFFGPPKTLSAGPFYVTCFPCRSHYTYAFAVAGPTLNAQAIGSVAGFRFQ